MDAVRAAGAVHAIDRAVEDVREAVNEYTGGAGVAAVFDPIGASTCDTSLQLLAPRGCLISYGELAGPAPDINLHKLFSRSVFVTKYNGMHWVKGVSEFPAPDLGGTHARRKQTCDHQRNRRTLLARPDH